LSHGRDRFPQCDTRAGIEPLGTVGRGKLRLCRKWREYQVPRNRCLGVTNDQLGKIGPDQGFGLGFAIDGVKAPLPELGSVGELGWGGFVCTKFSIDTKEQMIVIFMGQLHPAGDLSLDRQVHELAYQAIID
jgi:hypothetical protein